MEYGQLFDIPKKSIFIDFTAPADFGGVGQGFKIHAKKDNIIIFHFQMGPKCCDIFFFSWAWCVGIVTYFFFAVLGWG